MASQPGMFTQWPWQKLGNFKYAILAPWVAKSLYDELVVVVGEEEEEKLFFSSSRDMFKLAIFPLVLLRLFYTQLWISFSRFQTARGNHRIVDKSLEFEQVDRERNWDDQILLTAIVLYATNMLLPWAGHFPWWDAKGAVIISLLHAGPVEFLYYWLHRALHHHFLYSRYHSHHHASVVTEPITSVMHPFGEEVLYFLLFAIPMVTVSFIGRASIMSLVGYIVYIDFMNYMGHCNFELVPQWLFIVFPPLKYLMYTPSFHSLHHTKFRTNYSLFMPLYDFIYGTMDKSTDKLYDNSIKGKEDTPHVVHLTHLTTLQSIYQLRLGFSSLAAQPYSLKWYTCMMWPLTFLSILLTWICGSVFTVERNKLKKIRIQTWVVPRYIFQYSLPWERQVINGLIEKAISEAEERGVKVMCLCLLNQAEELNRFGEVYLQKYPKLKLRIVDGNNLAVAVVLKNIPQGTNQVLLRGNLSKITVALALVLCQRGVQVMMIQRNVLEMLKLHIPPKCASNLIFSNHPFSKVWVVGDGLRDEEQKEAPKGTIFIPFTQFPPTKARKDCVYYSTPAMFVPKTYENMHTCENWLPRRVMSAWRVAGIVHALEGWDVHECGDTVGDIDKVWLAALDHGFLPFALE